MIEIQKLTKTYRTASNETFDAIRDIDLSIEDGDIFGIIGLSGAGKSTLIRCINFLEKPTSGHVLFDGVDLGALSKKELLRIRRSMSMIFQSFNLFSQRNVLMNVCYPLEIAGVPKKEAKEKALRLLSMVGLEDRAGAYPAQLSGGQKQRVAIARALATDPKVLLCDEPTSALDPTTTLSVLSLLKEINEKMGVTVIIITHEMKVIETICSKVAVIADSRIAEQGSVREVFLSPRSKAAKQLILPKTEAVARVDGETRLRLVFDGNSAFEPVISNLTLDCGTSVNILAANTKAVDGKAYGEMLLQLPRDEVACERVRKYLSNHGIHFEEVSES